MNILTQRCSPSSEAFRYVFLKENEYSRYFFTVFFFNRMQAWKFKEGFLDFRIDFRSYWPSTFLKGRDYFIRKTLLVKSYDVRCKLQTWRCTTGIRPEIRDQRSLDRPKDYVLISLEFSQQCESILPKRSNWCHFSVTQKFLAALRSNTRATLWISQCSGTMCVHWSPPGIKQQVIFWCLISFNTTCNPVLN